MIDEKKAYFFGRNKQLCDFVIDHASCSRVHGVLLWHKHLNRPFIIDLGSSELPNLSVLLFRSDGFLNAIMKVKFSFGISLIIFEEAETT